MKRKSPQTRVRILTIAMLAAAFALATLLFGCSVNEGKDLPASHVDSLNAVNVGHERCGACHINGQRCE